MTFERSHHIGLVSQTFSKSERRIKAGADPLLVRVFGLLEDEIRKEEEGRQELCRLNARLEEMCDLNKELREEYQSVVEERRKAILSASEPVDNSNILGELER